MSVIRLDEAVAAMRAKRAARAQELANKAQRTTQRRGPHKNERGYRVCIRCERLKPIRDYIGDAGTPRSSVCRACMDAPRITADDREQIRRLRALLDDTDRPVLPRMSTLAAASQLADATAKWARLERPDRKWKW